jgi:hypothetical protein
MDIDKVWTGLQVLDIQSIFYDQLYCWAQKEKGLIHPLTATAWSRH